MKSEGKSYIPMLAVMYGSAFIAAFSENIINVALVHIMDEFCVNSITAQWLVTGYMIVNAVVVASAAFLIRRLGVRSLYFVAGSLFIVGNLIDIIAPNFVILLLGRLIQAAGTGTFITLMMSSVLELVPPQKMGTYLGIGGCIIVLGPAFGPVISGVLVTLLGWRWIFVPSLVIIVCLVVAGIFVVHNSSQPTKPRLDVLSLIQATIGLVCITFGLTQLLSRIILALALIVVGLALLVVFYFRQQRIQNPLLQITPLKRPRFLAFAIMTMIAMITSFSMSILLPLFFEEVLGMSAMAAGLLILLPIAFNSSGALFAGRIIDAKGTWPLIPLGFGLVTIGQIATIFVAGKVLVVAVVVASVVVFAGIGLCFGPCQAAALVGLDPKENADGVAITNVLVQVAAALGPSLYIGIYSNAAQKLMNQGVVMLQAQASGFSLAVLISSVIAAVGFVLAAIFSWRFRNRKEAQGLL